MTWPLRHAPLALALSGALMLGGCASSLSGVGSTEHFACQAPVGAQCTSISGVYANAGAIGRAAQDTLSAWPMAPIPLIKPLPNSAAKPLTAAPAIQVAPTQAATATATTATATTASSLRSPPRVLRVWVAPWEDADGDLHDAALLHVVVDTGRWLIERVRPAPRSRLDTATPPLVLSPTPTPTQATPADAPPGNTPPTTEP